MRFSGLRTFTRLPILAISFLGVILFGYCTYVFPTALAATASRYFYETQALDASVAHLQAHAFSLGGTRPVCPLRDWHEERYTGLANSSNIFLAINFYNNENVLPTFFQELPVVLRHLGTERVFVSIFENGSTDHTHELLELLQELLSELGVEHLILYDQSIETSRLKGHRIEVLSSVRNKALEPLYDGTAAESMPGSHFDEMLFMNDISFCAADIFELLYEKRTQGANQACTVDWMESVVYDRWVLRDIRGRPFYRWQDVTSFYNWLALPFASSLSPPLPDAPEDRARFERHLPLQVFSCWNGATVFDADAFTGPDGIRFRTSQSNIGEDWSSQAATDKASECFLSSVDMWKQGRGKIMIVPKASVSYDARHYRLHRKDHIIPNAHEGTIVWKEEPPAQVAMQDYALWRNRPERLAPWDEQR